VPSWNRHSGLLITGLPKHLHGKCVLFLHADYSKAAFRGCTSGLGAAGEDETLLCKGRHLGQLGWELG